MRRFTAVMFVLSWMLLLPAIASAQATVTGVVQDASGAVLPGVTVDASSPVLIEKVRTAVTDGNGRFQIVDLRPGLYRVSFSLTGFSTIVRDGVELTGSAVTRVDAQLRVGTIEEQVTVTGEAPTVDAGEAIDAKANMATRSFRSIGEGPMLHSVGRGFLSLRCRQISGREAAEPGSTGEPAAVRWGSPEAPATAHLAGGAGSPEVTGWCR